MSMLRGILATATIGCVLAACAPAAPRTSPDLAKEQAAVAPLKTKYKDVVTGVEIKDRTLILYVEPNAMYSMDVDVESAMKAEALSRWKRAWSDTHPHKHATLRLSVRDYFGRELSTSSTTV
jgi:hypothetical protein